MATAFERVGGDRSVVVARINGELRDLATEVTDTDVVEPVSVDMNDAQGLQAGQRVRVSPDDTRRGETEGEVVVASPSRVAVRRSHPSVGEVVIHFPRPGYRVTPL